MAAILVIDDSVSVLEWMQDVLTKAGHQVRTSSSGKQGILILRQVPIDLVITDFYMPELDGVEVIQHARRVAPQTRLVAMSTRPAEHSLFKTAKALGAVASLQKPFSQEQLLGTVATALGAGAGGSKRAKPEARLACGVMESASERKVT
jgi:DNA-binding NtrC family response regulator